MKQFPLSNWILQNFPKDVSDEMLEWKTQGTKLYQQLPNDCVETLKASEPLREITANKKKQDANYETWFKKKNE